MYANDERKLLSAICHGAMFVSSLIIPVFVPIVVLFISKDPVVRGNAKEAINFYLNVWICGAVIAFLISISWGALTPLIFPWVIFHWALTFLALFKVLTDSEKPFRYPFILRIL